jgi:hypothetical protein
MRRPLVDKTIEISNLDLISDIIRITNLEETISNNNYPGKPLA